MAVGDCTYICRAAGWIFFAKFLSMFASVTNSLALSIGGLILSSWWSESGFWGQEAVWNGFSPWMLGGGEKCIAKHVSV